MSEKKEGGGGNDKMGMSLELKLLAVLLHVRMVLNALQGQHRPDAGVMGQVAGYTNEQILEMLRIATDADITSKPGFYDALMREGYRRITTVTGGQTEPTQPTEAPDNVIRTNRFGKKPEEPK